jgi:hypothetical protein
MTTSWNAAEMAQLRRVVGDIGDEKLTAILALNPSFEQIEEAVLWADGQAESKRNSEWPLSGKIGDIFEILAPDIEDSRPN